MQDTTNNYTKKSSKPVHPLTLIFITALLATGGIAVYNFAKPSPTGMELNTVPSAPVIKSVTALGKLEPSGEVIQVSAPSSTQGDRVEELLVKKGDDLVKGQVMAILNSRDRAAADLKQAEERVKVAQASLAQIKAGAKTGEIKAQESAIARLSAERSNDIAAQEATLARLEAEVENARVENRRYQQLYADGAISASEKDSKQLTFETAQKQLEEARVNLKRIETVKQEQIKEAESTFERIAEVRPVDVEVAAAEVREAQAAVATAQAELDLAYIKAPITGRVIDILTRPGEVVSSNGIAQMGKTNQMYAVAEVYESDIGMIHLGQSVTVTSNAIDGELHGTVEEIDLAVQRQQVIDTDPAANTDAKVVEVRVELNEESSQKVERLTNLLVDVAISL